MARLFYILLIHRTTYKNTENHMTGKYTDEEIKFLIENYSKKGAKFCGEYLKRSYDTIQSKCKRLGLKVIRNWRSENGLKNKKTINDNYKVPIQQFINPTNPEIVYILGLLWADGYVCLPYEISLSTTYPDADYFSSLFLKTGDWKIYSLKKYKSTWKTPCKIITSNFYLVNFLINNDYKSKSYESADKILSLIPENLKHYWFRGLLDGDGYIRTDNKGSHSISFSSSYEQNWNYLEELCKKLDIKYHISKFIGKSNKFSSFQVYGIYKTIKLCEFIYNNYENDKLGLKRKYEKFLQLKATEEKNRYKGVSKMKNGKWRAYTSGAQHLKPKHLGIFNKKEDALATISEYYNSHAKIFIN